ncbi:lipid A deacylase LpxR family protein [Helicobacter cetorum]|uniref:Putative outer membrane protein n=1 Tax=Helicobacter cetorum (strain ATCC BAA-540 / CCUG 52418 / MIT 99-5656) TaxID=1163745 RepID=I0ESW3_HELCM|nr:lipid A deacylase LpxR family protein [Helicobacter cetorum]AFI06032.1 putative outer membrane protein [Helicobacter cetorum MIT 99-5656]
MFFKFILCLFLGIFAWAKEDLTDPLTPSKRYSINLLSENDAYVLKPIMKPTDEYYTAGTQIGFSTKEFDLSQNKYMKWASYLGFFNKSPRVTRFGISLAQDMYTPTLKNRKLTHLYHNHPYGGYLRVNLNVYNRHKTFMELFTLSLGTTGQHSLAAQIQHLVHQGLKDPQFYGWSRQLKNEFIFELHYQLLKKVPLLTTRFFSMELMPGFNLELGNARDYAQLGSLFRFGYNLDADYGVNKVNTDFSGGMPYSDKFSLYFFVGAFGRFQPFNIFIQGNSPETRGIANLEYFVYSGEMGVAMMWRGFRMAVTFTDISKTFQSQPKHHQIGTFELNFAF